MTPPANHAPASQPDFLGRFKILRQLGEGSQSVVYLALDPQLQREVAIKALRGSASTADALLNEARAVGRLSHPGIVPVFEVGEASPAQHNATSGGRTGAYLVFEYVAGPTLADVLKEQGALAPALAVRMLLPALEAVAYAHSRDVIHRDLKPSNILMDRRGNSRVMDFGIAVHGAEQSQQAHTADSAGEPDALGGAALMGTPAYMAPEYAQDGRTSPQMDVFSAGLILYEMLTGQRAAPEEMGYKAVLFLMHQDVRLPDALPYPVDEQLRSIVNQAAARDCRQRYATMDALVDALHDWQMGIPMPQTPQLPRKSDTEAKQALNAAVAALQKTALEGATPCAVGDAPPQAPASAAQAEIAQIPSTPTPAEITTPLRAAVLQEKRALDKLRLLLRRVQTQRDYPMLASTVGQVLPLASSDRQKVAVLSDAVLSDTSLSLKLLRMVNSSLYRGLGQGSVSVVSTAIQLLGYAAVRSTATAMASMATGHEAEQRARLLDDSLIAIWCGTVARELSGLDERDGEEAFVCGSLQWLGAMLITHCFAREGQLIDHYAPLGGQAPLGLYEQLPVLSGHRERAARHVLGIGMERLATGAARQWGLPDILVQSMYALGQSDEGEPTGTVAITRTRAEYLRALGNFARELVHVWLQTHPPREAAGTQQVIQRYTAALGLSAGGVQHAVHVATMKVKHLLQAQSQVMRQDLPRSLLAQRIGMVAKPKLDRLGHPSQAADTQASPVVPPVPGHGAAGVQHSMTLLNQGIERAAAKLGDSKFDLNGVLRQLLQTLQEATGFERVMLVLRQTKSAQMTGRMAVGPMIQPDASAFQLSLEDANDPFAAIVFNQQDTWIADSTRDGKRPEWHRQSFQTGCYLLLPLFQKNQAMGLIYADHTRPGGVVLTDRVLKQLGALRDQAVLAFKKHTV